MNKELQAIVTKSRILTSVGMPIYLEDEELFGLISIILRDLGKDEVLQSVGLVPRFKPETYFFIDRSQLSATCTMGLYELVARLDDAIPDFLTYLKCLCAIHKRRKKFDQILYLQPLPTMQQIAPRALLEYGRSPARSVASWITWRKWLYDIDNRSAQETGYIFEPILAAALGGIPYSASKSPIKRANDPSRGRQVDCIVDRYAYEFKLRVTIAASGQGRFQEELDFAQDCNSSGFIPNLLVLDPTPSAKYDELKRQYEKCGGQALAGEEAWQHIHAKSGGVMSIFVDKYVKTPLTEVENQPEELDSLTLLSDNGQFIVKLGEVTLLARPTYPGDKAAATFEAEQEDEA